MSDCCAVCQARTLTEWGAAYSRWEAVGPQPVINNVEEFPSRFTSDMNKGWLIPLEHSISVWWTQPSKWLEEIDFNDLTLLWVDWKLAGHCHFYIKELSQLADGQYVILLKWIMFGLVTVGEHYPWDYQSPSWIQYFLPNVQELYLPPSLRGGDAHVRSPCDSLSGAAGAWLCCASSTWIDMHLKWPPDPKSMHNWTSINKKALAKLVPRQQDKWPKEKFHISKVTVEKLKSVLLDKNHGFTTNEPPPISTRPPKSTGQTDAMQVETPSFYLNHIS
ncbi:hypothetical protein B0H10DRAFT_1974036 [Mycena sp. CBHHK59/15]|nr:hypothetical protein B0H10DRAFT_1974036 [Mycena sp. CBHHK59/15]